MRILRRPCLPGCAGHLPTADGEIIHISSEQRIPLGEGGTAYISREQAPGQPPAVRIQGAGDAPMTPAQAVQLGLALIAEAFAATTWTVTPGPGEPGGMCTDCSGTCQAYAGNGRWDACSGCGGTGRAR